MSTQILVTGMLRCGTSLTQVLLTNHPDMWVVYQPFHQLYVDVKQMFLDASGLDVSPPLDDGGPAPPGRREAFHTWLAERVFSPEEARRLARRAVTGKGGSMAHLEGRLTATAGRFATLRQSLHASMASELGAGPATVVGSKEILCEEYVSALVATGVRCIIVLRDPRAVIASANHGRYRDSVGDRYPLLMLVRLWRKSADYWLRFREHPLVRAIRYEDLVADPDAVLSGLADWLEIGAFPDNMGQTSLRDHMGEPWQGNSSFGDKATINGSSADNWRRLLSRDEIRFIDACTFPELAATGYSVTQDVCVRDILEHEEDITQVRPAYLARHALSAQAKALEARRFDASIATVRGFSR